MVSRVALILFSSISYVWACSAPTNDWQSSEGNIAFPATPQTSFYARYTQDKGRILARLQGQTLTGYWVETDSAHNCASKVDGSSFWGRIEFFFDAKFQRFSGKWSYCDDIPRHAWSGRRKGPLNGDCGSPAAAPPSLPIPQPEKAAELLDLAFVSAKTGKRYGVYDTLRPYEPFRLLATFSAPVDQPSDKLVLQAKQTGSLNLGWYPARRPNRLVTGDISRGYADGEWLVAQYQGRQVRIRVKHTNVRMHGPDVLSWGDKPVYELSLHHERQPIRWFPSVQWSVEPAIAGFTTASTTKRGALVLPSQSRNGSRADQVITITAKAKGETAKGMVRKVIRKRVLITDRGQQCIALTRARDVQRERATKVSKALQDSEASLAQLAPIFDPSSLAMEVKLMEAERGQQQANLDSLEVAIDELRGAKKALQVEAKQLASTHRLVGRSMTQLARTYASKSWYKTQADDSNFAAFLYLQATMGKLAPHKPHAKVKELIVDADIITTREKTVVLGKAFVDLGGLAMLGMPSPKLSPLAGKVNKVKGLALFFGKKAYDKYKIKSGAYLERLKADTSNLHKLQRDIGQLKTLAQGVENGTVEKGVLNQQLVNVYGQLLNARFRLQQRIADGAEIMRPLVQYRNKLVQALRQQDKALMQQRQALSQARQAAEKAAAERKRLQRTIDRQRRAMIKVQGRLDKAEQQWRVRCDEADAVRIEVGANRYAAKQRIKVRVFGGQQIPPDAVLQVHAVGATPTSGNGVKIDGRTQVQLAAPQQGGRYVVSLFSPVRGLLDSKSIMVSVDLSGMWKSADGSRLQLSQRGDRFKISLVELGSKFTQEGFHVGDTLGEYGFDRGQISGYTVVRFGLVYKKKCPQQWQQLVKATVHVLNAGSGLEIRSEGIGIFYGSCKVGGSGNDKRKIVLERLPD